MGVVYRARDTALGRDVAVELLAGRFPPGSPATERLLTETRITGRLQHPGIPAVHQAGTRPDGRRLVSGSRDGTVKVWDLTGLQRKTKE